MRRHYFRASSESVTGEHHSRRIPAQAELGRGTLGIRNRAKILFSWAGSSLLASWFDFNQVGAFGFSAAGHLAPGFAVLFHQGALAVGGIEAKDVVGGGFAHRDDVPEVLGDDEGDEEVDLVSGVAGVASGGFDAVAGIGVALGGFDLHPPELASGVEDEVVAFAVAPGFGDAEAEAGGFGQEGGLGGFAAAFAGDEADGVDFGDLSGKRDVSATVASGRIVVLGTHNKKGAARKLRLRDSFIGMNIEKGATVRPRLFSSSYTHIISHFI